MLFASFALLGWPWTAVTSRPAWTVSATFAMAFNPAVASDVTVRQVVPLSAGGSAVRVQISNLFGGAPLLVGAGAVGEQQQGRAVIASTVHTLTFGGRPSVTIPAGATVYSDPVTFAVRARETLDVSVWVPGTAAVSQHYDAGPVSYSTVDGAGNLSADTSGAGFGLPETWARWISAVDVAGVAAPRSATVVLGDSISDGFNPRCATAFCALTTPWPALLATRLAGLPSDGTVAVANESITANTLTSIPTPEALRYRLGGGGPPGLNRLSADVLTQPGADRLVLLLGTNDLWFGASADQVIAGVQSLLAEARRAGVGVIAGTLLPRAGSEGWTAQMERYREKVNAWIVNSHAFSAVVNFARVVSDVYDGACRPNQMFALYDSGDHLHPDTAGQIAMANAVPTTALGAAAAPTLEPAVAVTPTPGCGSHPQVTTHTPLAHPPMRHVVPSRHDRPTTTTAPTTAATRTVAAASPRPFPGRVEWTAALAAVGAVVLGVGLRFRHRRKGREKS